MPEQPAGRGAIAPGLGAQASCRRSALLSSALKSGQGPYSPPSLLAARGNAPGTQGELGGRPPRRLSSARANCGAAHCAGSFAAGRARRAGAGAGRAEPGAVSRSRALGGLQGPPERLMKRILRLT